MRLIFLLLITTKILSFDNVAVFVVGNQDTRDNDNLDVKFLTDKQKLPVLDAIYWDESKKENELRDFFSKINEKTKLYILGHGSNLRAVHLAHKFPNNDNRNDKFIVTPKGKIFARGGVFAESLVHLGLKSGQKVGEINIISCFSACSFWGDRKLTEDEVPKSFAEEFHYALGKLYNIRTVVVARTGKVAVLDDGSKSHIDVVDIWKAEDDERAPDRDKAKTRKGTKVEYSWNGNQQTQVQKDGKDSENSEKEKSIYKNLTP